MAEFDYQELVKATENFSPSRLIGKGSHGSVYKAILLRENKIFAIKKSFINSSVDHISIDSFKKLENEISVLSSLRSSPYIIDYIGTSREENRDQKIMVVKKVLVMEFMPNGSLHDLLHFAKIPPSWPKRVQIAIQVAKAIEFLHEHKPLVIHRDVKSPNVLFDSNWNAKLADYGLAVSRVNLSSDQASQPAGTIGYMDPGYTIPSKLSTKNDVFSFGVVLLEIISGRKAIDLKKSPISITEWAIPLLENRRLIEIIDKRIELPPTYIESMITRVLYLAARCVACKEESRPSIKEIVTAMGSCSVERVRAVVPNNNYWISLLRRFMAIRRQRKLNKKLHSQMGRDHCNDFSKEKILLRELVLTDKFN